MSSDNVVEEIDWGFWVRVVEFELSDADCCGMPQAKVGAQVSVRNA